MKDILNQVKKAKLDAKMAEARKNELVGYEPIFKKLINFKNGVDKRGVHNFILYSEPFFILELNPNHPQDPRSYVYTASPLIRGFFHNLLHDLERRIISETAKPYKISDINKYRLELYCFMNLIEQVKEHRIPFDIKQVIINLVRNYRPENPSKVREFPFPFVSVAAFPQHFEGPYDINENLNKSYLEEICQELKLIPEYMNVDAVINSILFLRHFGPKKPKLVLPNASRHIERCADNFQLASLVYNLERVGFDTKRYIGNKRLQISPIFQDMVRAPRQIFDGFYQYDHYVDSSIINICQKYSPDIFDGRKVRLGPLNEYLDHVEFEYGKRFASEFKESAERFLINPLEQILDSRDYDKYAYHINDFLDWIRTGTSNLSKDK